MSNDSAEGNRIAWKLITSHALSILVGGIVALVGWSFYAGNQYGAIMAKLTENQAKVMDVQARMTVSEADRATMHTDLKVLQAGMERNDNDHRAIMDGQKTITARLDSLIDRIGPKLSTIGPDSP